MLKLKILILSLFLILITSCSKSNSLILHFCSILLSIILSNCHLYKDNNQEFIMLFDEISSHIDKSNLKKFFNLVSLQKILKKVIYQKIL